MSKEIIKEITYLLKEETYLIDKREELNNELKKCTNIINDLTNSQTRIISEIGKCNNKIHEHFCKRVQYSEKLFKILSIDDFSSLDMIKNKLYSDAGDCVNLSNEFSNIFLNDKSFNLSGDQTKLDFSARSFLESSRNDAEISKDHVKQEVFDVSLIEKNDSQLLDANKTAASNHEQSMSQSIITKQLLALKIDNKHNLYKSYLDNAVEKVNVLDKNNMITMYEHPMNVSLITINCDLNLLYTYCEDGYIRAFDSKEDLFISRYYVDDEVNSISICFTGNIIVSTVNSWIYIINKYLQRTIMKYKLSKNSQLKKSIFTKVNDKNVFIVFPLNFYPAIVNPFNGKVYEDFGCREVQDETLATVQSNICFYTNYIEESNLSLISAYDLSNDCKKVWSAIDKGKLTVFEGANNFIYDVIKRNELFQIRCQKVIKETMTVIVYWLKYINISSINFLTIYDENEIYYDTPNGEIAVIKFNENSTKFKCNDEHCKCETLFNNVLDRDYHSSFNHNA